MSQYNVKGYYKLTEEITVETKFMPNYPLFTDDVFTKGSNGTYTKHTGICITNLVLPEDKLEYFEDTARLVI